MKKNCEHCGSEVDVCNICQKIINLETAVSLEFERGRVRWGPVCDECFSKIDIAKVRSEIGPERLVYILSPTIRHSRDLTDRHDMTDLLDDMRTRPTEPPTPLDCPVDPDPEVIGGWLPKQKP